MKIFAGVVQRGSQRAKALGYPTINIPLEDVDLQGIYAARVSIQDEAPYMAAAFADSNKGILEAHILDFEDDLYGLEVKIELFDKVRDTEEFKDDDTLKAAIERDIAKVRDYFHN